MGHGLHKEYPGSKDIKIKSLRGPDLRKYGLRFMDSVIHIYVGRQSVGTSQLPRHRSTPDDTLRRSAAHQMARTERVPNLMSADSLLVASSSSWSLPVP